MGMFDTVIFECPTCGSTDSTQVQSKAGDCRLRDYSSEAVPANIAMSIEGDMVWCSNCDSYFKVAIRDKPRAVSMYLENYSGVGE